MDHARIKDALYNLREDSGASVEYARGILVGVMSALIAYNGSNFSDAAHTVKGCMPQDYRQECLPETWNNSYFSS